MEVENLREMKVTEMAIKEAKILDIGVVMVVRVVEVGVVEAEDHFLVFQIFRLFLCLSQRVIFLNNYKLVHRLIFEIEFNSIDCL